MIDLRNVRSSGYSYGQFFYGYSLSLRADNIGMKMEYSNKTVYNFLIEECKTMPELWEKFGVGVMEHTSDVDFWDRLSEELDCFRVCNECGKPMIEGFVVDGCDTYCSEECLHKHMSEEDYDESYNNGDGDTYWTTWYEDSNTCCGNN